MTRRRIAFGTLALLFLVCLSITIKTSPLTSRKYENESLGISLVIPGNWELEVTERFLSLVLTPKWIYSGDNSVSIVVWASDTLEQNLNVAILNDIERLKAVSNLDDIAFLRYPEIYSNNNYEAAIATILMPTESTGQANHTAPSSTQPLDIVAINGKDRLIFVFVRKSNTVEFLNSQADGIVKSIELLAQDD